jgi:hypothetical protein
MTLDEALALPRVAITGGPHTGKSSLARRIADGRLVMHTDPDELPEEIRAMLAKLPERDRWSALSAEVVRRLAGVERFAVEGIRVAHALRKGLQVDAVVWCTRVFPKPGHPRKPKHEQTAKSIATVFQDWLASRPGVPVVRA